MQPRASKKKKDRLQYPCHHPFWRVSYSAYVPISDPPKKYEIVKDDVEEELIRSYGPDFEVEDLNESHRLNKAALSDLVTDLDLPKQKSELLSSSTRIYSYQASRLESRTREKNILHFFEKKEHVVAYIDVNGLMNFTFISYDPNN
ncbi:hypothetical protein TNIN_371681 [Trichonephila inaurata madagascariensis]|uniref:Uncharacterized protein n=1 Tax=Trichonephila inaurata madagascariensis TaxID=2747483 RepID=A0A8X7C3W0_9ARAC|nr:hypothetical protein TNIN_371681 [Trichonephila inaurata madagascariensis]